MIRTNEHNPSSRGIFYTLSLQHKHPSPNLSRSHSKDSRHQPLRPTIAPVARRSAPQIEEEEGKDRDLIGLVVKLKNENIQLKAELQQQRRKHQHRIDQQLKIEPPTSRKSSAAKADSTQNTRRRTDSSKKKPTPNKENEQLEREIRRMLVKEEGTKGRLVKQLFQGLKESGLNINKLKVRVSDYA